MEIDVRRFDSKRPDAYGKRELLMIAKHLDLDVNFLRHKKRNTLASMIFERLPKIYIEKTKKPENNNIPILPKEMMLEIASHLDVMSLGRFSQCSKDTHEISIPLLEKMKKEVYVHLEHIEIGSILVHTRLGLKGNYVHDFFKVIKITPTKRLRLAHLKKKMTRLSEKESKFKVSPIDGNVSPKLSPRLTDIKRREQYLHQEEGIKFRVDPIQINGEYVLSDLIPPLLLRGNYKANFVIIYMNHFLYDSSKEYIEYHTDV